MVLRGSSGPISWPLWGLAATLLVGLLLGGHQRHGFAEFPLLLSYAYWVLRLGMAYLLFAGALALLELSPLTPRIAWPWLALAAGLVTLPLFTLCVTMLDLLLGLPELGPGARPGGFGLDSSGAPLSAGAMAALFGLESLYHLDNHLALCALIVAPRLLLSPRAADALPAPPLEAGSRAMAGEAPVTLHQVTLHPVRLPPPAPSRPLPAVLARFDPPVKGRLLAVQAQEHYVRLITSEGAYCTLYRFGDALRDLEGLSGLQVHRSFWVADAGVAAVRNDRRGLRIVLRNGEQVPVSARHADLVQRRYGERLETVA